MGLVFLYSNLNFHSNTIYKNFAQDIVQGPSLLYLNFNFNRQTISRFLFTGFRLVEDMSFGKNQNNTTERFSNHCDRDKKLC